MRGSSTYQAWLTAVIDVNQIAVEVQMLVLAHLDCSISWRSGLGRRWEVDLRVQSEWCDIDSADGL